MFSEFALPRPDSHRETLSQAIASRLPRAPISGPRPGPRLKRRALQEALNQPYLQFNGPGSTGAIIVDADHSDMVLYQDRRIPAPAWIVYDTRTGRHHLGWLLADPVYYGVHAKTLKPKQLLDWTRRLLTIALDGDLAYTNQLARNPLNPGPDARTIIIDPTPHDLRELADLIADNVDDGLIAKVKRFRSTKIEPDADGSRNVSLFNAVRQSAYRIRGDYDSESSLGSAVSALAAAGNNFSPPLPPSEVRSIARSVTKWTWRTISPNFRPSRFQPSDFHFPKNGFGVALRPDDYNKYPPQARRPEMVRRCWKIRFDEAVLTLIPLLREPRPPGPQRPGPKIGPGKYTSDQLAAQIGLCVSAAREKIHAALEALSQWGDQAETAYRALNPDMSAQRERQPRRNPRKIYAGKGRYRPVPAPFAHRHTPGPLNLDVIAGRWPRDIANQIEAAKPFWTPHVHSARQDGERKRPPKQQDLEYGIACPPPVEPLSFHNDPARIAAIEAAFRVILNKQSVSASAR